MEKFWQFFWVVAAGAALAIFSSAARQTDVALGQPPHVRFCFEIRSSCLTNPFFPETSRKSIAVNAKRRAPAKLAQKPLSRPTKAECLMEKRASSAYNANALEMLAQANAQADKIRRAAEASGESYLAFDNQLNTLFAAYNVRAQRAYESYLQNLRGCPPAHTPPVLFQKFLP